MPTKKQADKIAVDIYNEVCKGIQFSIFDVSKVLESARSAIMSGQNQEIAKKEMIKAAQLYRKN